MRCGMQVEIRWVWERLFACSSHASHEDVTLYGLTPASCKASTRSCKQSINLQISETHALAEYSSLLEFSGE
jgi:hypothetical protein